MESVSEFFIHNYGFAGVVAAVLAFVWWDLRGSINIIANSMTTLTTQLAVVVERVDSHEKRLDRIEFK